MYKCKKGAALYILLLLLTFTFPSKVLGFSSFSQNDFFAIPNQNSSVSFAYSGSYDSASFEADFWRFSSLVLNSPGPNLGKSHYLEVSAQNSNLSITHIDTLTWIDQVGWLTYTVQGDGNQTFNVHWLSEGFVCEFKVYIDSVEKQRNDEWTLGPGKNPVTDNMLTVTGASHGVSIGYCFNPELIGPEPSFQKSPDPSSTNLPVSLNQSQIQGHSQNPIATLTPSASIPEFPIMPLVVLLAITSFVVLGIKAKSTRLK